MNPSQEIRNSLPTPEQPGRQVVDQGVSRWKLALGAASLFFFVVGVKRSFRTDDGREILKSDADLLIKGRTDRPVEPRPVRKKAARIDPVRAVREAVPSRDDIRATAARIKRGSLRDDAGRPSSEGRGRRER